MNLQYWFGSNRDRYVIGTTLFGITISIINILSFAKLWVADFEAMGIPPIALYIGIPAGYIFGCWFTGFIYQITGIYAQEASFNNQHGNPEFSQMIKDIRYDQGSG